VMFSLLFGATFLPLFGQIGSLTLAQKDGL